VASPTTFENQTTANLALPSSSEHVISISKPVEVHSNTKVDYLEPEELEDTQTKVEDVTLSLEKQEKEIIIKALLKNKNKRKYAARDLGISERTLYRKIKQYDLEDM
jgi:transcriptional regulator with PAS, ATPase and Fis domain